MIKVYKGWIYMWTNNVTNKMYIGKSNNIKMRKQWFLEFDSHYAGPHIDRARKKYPDAKYWDYKILEELEEDDRQVLNQKLNELEISYIKLYKANDKSCGYNISSGGTWGDTWAALSDKEREQRIEKRKTTIKKLNRKCMYKGMHIRLVPDCDQGFFLSHGWSFEMPEKMRKRFSRRIKKYWNSEEGKQKKKETKERQKERKIQQAIKRQKMKEERNATPEWQQHLEDLRQMKINIRVAYNKSEEHRQATIRSNKTRWKDGCPEETRKKMKKSIAKYWKTHDIIWISKGDKTKMIDISKLPEYESEGWSKGRNFVPHNKKIK